MWQKGYAIKTKNHVVVAMCIGVPVFLKHSVIESRQVERLYCTISGFFWE